MQSDKPIDLKMPAKREDPPESPLKLVHANLETQHFTFDVYAATQAEAERLMRLGWNKHAEQTGAAPFSYWSDAVKYKEVELGQVLRDGEPMRDL